MIVFIIVILALIQFITTIEMSMVMPLAPVIAKSFNVNSSMVSILNLGFTLSGILSLFFGYKADKSGIKSVMILSLSLFSLGCLIVSFNSIYFYIIGRFLVGVGYFSLSSIITSYTTKLVNSKKLGLVSGIYKIAFSIGLFISPQLSLVVIRYFHFAKIYLLLFVISLLFIFICLTFKDFKNDEINSITIQGVINIFKDSKSQLYIFSNFFLSLPAVYFYSFTSVYLSEIGYTQVWISNLYSFVALGSILGGILITLFADKIGMYKLSVLSTFVAGILLIVMIISKNWMYVGFLFGICYDTIWGLFYPVGSMFYKNKASTFLTILSLVTSLTNSFSNISAPILYKLGGYNLLILICGFGMCISSYLMYKAIKLAFNNV